MKIDFVDVLEIVAPSKKMLNSGLQCKNHTLFLTKTAKKTHPVWGCTHLYSPYKGVPTRGTTLKQESLKGRGAARHFWLECAMQAFPLFRPNMRYPIPI